MDTLDFPLPQLGYHNTSVFAQKMPWSDREQSLLKQKVLKSIMASCIRRIRSLP